MKSERLQRKRSESGKSFGCWWGILACVLSGYPAGLAAQVGLVGTQSVVAPGDWNAPASVAVDGSGNLYVADAANNQVVELSPTGTGYGAPVTILSRLSGPGGVACDWNGNVFVSDTGNGRIVMLLRSATGFGAPVTLAEGLISPNGLAVDTSDDVFVAVAGSNNVVEIGNGSAGYLSPVVVGSGFNRPMGVAVDANRDLFIADSGNNRVVKEPRSSTGYATQQVLWSNLNNPLSLAIDKGNDVFIVANGSQQVVEMVWQPGAARFGSSAIIGSGMVSPTGVAVSSAGQVFFTDAGNAQLAEVQGAGIDFGDVAVGTTGARITYNFSVGAGVSLSGISIETQGVAGQDFEDGGATTCGAQTYTKAVVCGVSVAFNPLAPGTRMGAAVLWGTSGNALATAFLSGVGVMPKVGFLPGAVTQIGAQLSGPTGVAVDGAGNVYIADTGNNRIVELPWTGSGYGQQSVLPVSGLMNPMGLAIDGAGNLYIVSNGNDKVICLPWTPSGFGTPVKVGSGLYGPSSVVVGADGTVYITDTLDQRIDRVSWTGSGFAQETQVGNYHKAPIGLAVDGSATLYFSDPYQNSVSELPWNGARFLDQVYLPVAGTSFPVALAADANADLFILDGVTNQLVMLPRNSSGFGTQMTIAGGFNSPSGMTIDSNGVLYIADTGNNQIVRIDMSTPGALSYASTYLGSTSADSPQAAMVGNLGNLPVALSAISFPVDFLEATAVADGCTNGTVLSASQWCELAIAFTPTVASPVLSEAVTVTDNSFGIAGTTQQISVSGVSLAKSSQSINFTAPAGTVYGVPPVALSATATSGLPVSFNVISGPGVLISNGRILRITGVGTIIVQASQAGNGAFAAAAPVMVGVTVAPATLTVIPANVNATYGAIPSNFSYTFGGFVNGDNSFAVSGRPVITFGGSSGSAVGSYTLQASLGSLTSINYVFAFATGTLTVNPAILQVRVACESTVYGKPLPALRWVLSGFVNGDSAASVVGAPQLTTTANSGSPAGQYPIVAKAGTLTSANYAFAFSSGTLVVGPALLTVTAASPTAVYGAALPALTYSISGFVNGDSAASSVQGAANVNTIAAQGAGAGRYAVNVSAGSLTAANYTFAFVPGVLTVVKAVIQVTPQNASMTYGGNLPVLAYAMSGFVNGDSAASAVSGKPAMITAANSHSIPGTFAITCAMGSLVSSNYGFVFGNAVLTVTKAPLTVTPVPASITYGQRVPVPALSYQGFVNGDGVSSLQGTPSSTPQAAQSLAAGTYAVTIAPGSMTSMKYEINLQSGTLTVRPAVLTVQAQGGAMIYGGKAPALMYSLHGFVNGDSANQVSGAPELDCAASATSAVGVYAVTVKVGSLAAANYTFAFVNSTITVSKAVLTVLPGNVSTIYGAALPAMTYSLTGLLNADTSASAVSGAPQFETAATSASPAGTYPLTAALGTLTAKNYSFVFSNGTITVGKALLTVTAGNASMTAGAAVPALSYTMKGFANDETQASATSGKPTITTSASSASKAGSYTIVAAQGSLSAKNYAFSFVNGTLTVNQ